MKWFKHLVLLFLPAVGWTAFPAQFTYQGSLKHNGALVNGTYPMEFRLTNSDGSQIYWTSGVQNIAVQEGLYRVDLTPSNVSWGNIEPYVQVSVSGNILLPREKLNSAPYAMMAKELAPNAVGRGDFQLMGKLRLVDSSLANNQDEIIIQAADTLGSNPFQLGLGFRSNTPSIQTNRVNVGPQSLLLNPDGGNVGIGLTHPHAILTLYQNNLSGPGVTNTLFGAGYNSAIFDGNRQFLVQQWLTNNTAKTYLVGNGYLTGTNAPFAHDGPSTKFQAIEFQDSRFGFVYNEGGSVTTALSVNPTNGFVGIGTGDQTSRLEVAGNVEVHGMLKNENNKPAFFVNVWADDCGGSHPYLGCPSGYAEGGRWHTGPSQGCNGSWEGYGYENGQIDNGWMVMCVAQ